MITDTGEVMMQRWSSGLSQALRTFLRRGALFVLGGTMAVTVSLSPVATQPANAASLFGDALGGLTSFTNSLSSCAIETVGWVICPTMRSIAKLADYGFSYINKGFLRIDYSLAANSSGTYKAWEMMRNIANALFVIAFMAIVYTQLTGRASGGYNIKRLLPRLVIAAIAVNVSYYLCVIMIDFSNIIGNALLEGLNELAKRVGPSVMPIEKSPTGNDTGTLTQITSAILSSPSVAWVLLAPVAAVTISVATITAAALILLIMRKTVVAMLILISPILFVAYLLPNLERFFSQGARLFLQLLLLYPILALLLGAGQIVSATISTAGSEDANYRVTGDSYFSRNGGSGSAITDLTAAGAAVVPLLGAWFLFKNMNSIMSTAGSRLTASIRSRTGQDDKEARVTGKATVGAANAKNTGGLGHLVGRRQAFSRNRRKSSLSGSSLRKEDGGGTKAGLPTGRNNAQAEQNALNAAGKTGSEEAAKKFEELQNARINGEADGLDVDSLATEALSGAPDQNGKDEEKHVTAKDLFNNLNQSHESKDKDRKFASGPAPAGGGGGQSGGAGTAQPTAPSSSYRAPAMAQNNNIVSGTTPATGHTKIVAVPVQIDGSALLGQNSSHHPPDNITQPPISGTEEKAKTRAQKYLFESDKQLDETRDAIDIFGHKDAPTEQPHTSTQHDDNEDDKKDNNHKDKD